jgi:hypothetical protein
MRLADLLALADDDGRRRWGKLELGYTTTWGLSALREEIARAMTTPSRRMSCSSLAPANRSSSRCELGSTPIAMQW